MWEDNSDCFSVGSIIKNDFGQLVMAWSQKCLMMDLIIINMQTFTSKDINW